MANSPILQIPLLSTSQAAKETTINTMVSYLERAMNDVITVVMSSGSVTIPTTDLRRYFVFKLTGALGGTNLNIAAVKRMFCIDNTSNGVSVNLTCGSDSLTINAGAVVLVICDGVNLISVADSTVTGGGGGVTTLTGLLDVPNTYNSEALKLLRVKSDETGIEFVALSIGDLDDVDLTGIANGDTLKWDGTKFVAAEATSGGVSAEASDIVVRAATTANIPDIDPILVVGGTLDGVTLALNDLVLVKNQSTTTENGVYQITNLGPVRADFMDVGEAVGYGLTILVAEGTDQAGTQWFQTSTNSVVDSSPMTFSIVTSTLRSMQDFDSAVTLTDGMVMIYDAPTAKWVPTITSTSLPTGGTTGQALVKNSNADYDFGFTTLIPAGGDEGQVLAKASAANGDYEWVDLPEPPNVQPGVRTVAGATDTPVLADANSFIVVDNGADVTVTIPPESGVNFLLGTSITFVQRGLGKVAIVGGTGVTIRYPDGTFLNRSAERYATIAVAKIGTNEWVLTGHLEVA